MSVADLRARLAGQIGASLRNPKAGRYGDCVGTALALALRSHVTAQWMWWCTSLHQHQKTAYTRH